MKSLKQRREEWERRRRNRHGHQSMSGTNHGDDYAADDDYDVEDDMSKYYHQDEEDDDDDDDDDEVQIVHAPLKQEQNHQRQQKQQQQQQQQQQRQHHRQQHHRQQQRRRDRSPAPSHSTITSTAATSKTSKSSTSKLLQGRLKNIDTENKIKNGGTVDKQYDWNRSHDNDDDWDDEDDDLDDLRLRTVSNVANASNKDDSSSEEEPYYMSFSQVANPNRHASSAGKKKRGNRRRTRQGNNNIEKDSHDSESSSSSSSSLLSSSSSSPSLSSSSSSSSSDEGGYESYDSRIDQRKEPLRPGDVITYQLPVFTAGTNQGINQAVVVETDPYNPTYVVKLSTNDHLPPDTFVRRVQEYGKDGTLYPHRHGCLKPLVRFKMKKRSLPTDQLDALLSNKLLMNRARQLRNVRDELERRAVDILSGKHDKSNDNNNHNHNNSSSINKKLIASDKGIIQSKSSSRHESRFDSPSRTQTSSQVTSDSASLSSSSLSPEEDSDNDGKCDGLKLIRYRRRQNTNKEETTTKPSSGSLALFSNLENKKSDVKNTDNIQDAASALLGLSRSTTTTALAGTAAVACIIATATTATTSKTTSTDSLTNIAFQQGTSSDTTPTQNAGLKEISVGIIDGDRHDTTRHDTTPKSSSNKKYRTTSLLLSSESDDSDDDDNSILFQNGRPQRKDNQILKAPRSNHHTPTGSKALTVGTHTSESTHQHMPSTSNKTTSSVQHDCSHEGTERSNRHFISTTSTSSELSKNRTATSSVAGLFSLSKLNCNGKNSGNKRLDVDTPQMASSRSSTKAGSTNDRRRRLSGTTKHIRDNYKPLQIERKPGFAAAYQRLEERKERRRLRLLHAQQLAADESETVSTRNAKTNRAGCVKTKKDNIRKTPSFDKHGELSNHGSSSSIRKSSCHCNETLKMPPKKDSLHLNADETSEEEFNWSPPQNRNKRCVAQALKRSDSEQLICGDQGSSDDKVEDDKDVIIVENPSAHRPRRTFNANHCTVSLMQLYSDGENGDVEGDSESDGDKSSTCNHQPIAKRPILESKQAKRKAAIETEIPDKSSSPQKRRKTRESCRTLSSKFDAASFEIESSDSEISHKSNKNAHSNNDVTKSIFSTRILNISRTGAGAIKKKTTDKYRGRIPGLSSVRQKPTQKRPFQVETDPIVHDLGSVAKQSGVTRKTRTNLSVDSPSTSSTSSDDKIDTFTPRNDSLKLELFRPKCSSEKSFRAGKSDPCSAEKSIFDFDGEDENDLTSSGRKKCLTPATILALGKRRR